MTKLQSAVLSNEQIRAGLGPPLPDAYGSKADAIGGGAAEVRQTAAPCPKLRYGLTEIGHDAIDPIDPRLKLRARACACQLGPLTLSSRQRVVQGQVVA